MQYLDGPQGIAEGAEEISVSAYENYAKEKLRQQEYQKLRIGLERLNRSLALIEGSWQRMSRRSTLYELENILKRRNIAEEVIWEIEADI